MSETNPIWSDTDFTCVCLMDQPRTETFRRAIEKVVRHGDTVIDIGSGSGILSLFAAQAGAAKVYAVEIDGLLAKTLRHTVKANGFDNVIEVVEGDAMDVDLPRNVDVVVAEIIETGLMDEMQVPVMNRLHADGIIGPKTRVIPQAYETNLELVHVGKMYGFDIKAPFHNWPYYSTPRAQTEGWLDVEVTPVSDKIKVLGIDLERELQRPEVATELTFAPTGASKPANGIRISGILTLVEGIEIHAMNSVNGDKVLALDEDINVPEDGVRMQIFYVMGGDTGGLHSFKATQI